MSSTHAHESTITDHRPQLGTTTETKPSYKTTELAVYLVAVVGVLIASAVTDQGSDGQGFGAERAWFFITLLTVGYLVSRGLAKAGSYDKELVTQRASSER
ncbi:MAG: hypothetical protein WB441_10240 [Nocardioidaceae bacterium]